MRPTGLSGRLAVGAGLTLVYFLAGKLGLSLALIHPSASAVWPPTGITLAALLVLGTNYWPAVFLGAFLVNVTTAGSIATSLGIAVGNTLEGLAGAWLVNRFAGGRNVFESAEGYFRFVLLAAFASTTISATVGVNTLAAARLAEPGNLRAIWLTWWLGDAVGTIVFAPLSVLWFDPRWLSRSASKSLEAFLLLLSLVCLGLVSFGPFPWARQQYPLSFLPTPILIWAGFRFGRRATMTASLLMGVIAIWGTLQGYGPFARLPQHQSLVLLQLFLGLVSVMAFAVAVVVYENRGTAAALRRSQEELELRIQERTAGLSSAIERLRAEIEERQSAQTQLAESEAKFRDLLESAADAICIVGLDGKIRMVNTQVERFFGYGRDELLGQPVELLIPESLRRQHLANRHGFFANPHVRTMGEGLDLFGRRKDGSEFPVDISLSPIQTKEGPLVSAAIRDLTRRKREEAERRATEVLKSQVEELSRSTREITTLNRMSDMLRAAIGVDEAYPLVPRYLEELFPLDSGAVYVFHGSRTFLESVARWGNSPPDEDVIQPNDCWALRRGRSHVVEGLQVGGACLHLHPPLPDTSLCIPMLAQGETLGLFHLRAAVATKRGHVGAPTLAEHKQRLAQAAAEQIAGGLAHAKLHSTLRAQASRDPLTGLLNRRSLDEALDRELHRAARHQWKLGILMIDLDRFKEFNDRFGHAAGDVALREIGQFLMRHARREDIVCRLGGEEMTIVLSDCSLKDLLRRAEQIREGTKSLSLEHDGRKLDAVTVSVGIAVFPEHGRTPEQLLQAADKALYRAKGDGRDRVVVAPLAKLAADSE